MAIVPYVAAIAMTLSKYTSIQTTPSPQNSAGDAAPTQAVPASPIAVGFPQYDYHRHPDELVSSIFKHAEGVFALERMDVVDGPNGFTYTGFRISRDPARDTKWFGNGEFAKITLSKGHGIVVFPDLTSSQPESAYSYGKLLSLSIFGDSKPTARFDPDAHKATIDAPIVPGTKVIQGRPSDQLFPAHARHVLAERFASVIGADLPHEVFVFEYPDIDKLMRFKIVIPSYKQLTPAQQKAVSDAAFWCLPYAVYITAQF